ncbi:glycosyltransferase family 4 protein [Methylomonas paludis]|uniref:Glycosyltransferase family 4 protein n=1 Tax=Methylomonas paludis TaxID=1173101 RepID=A0A975MQL2_9GAMM|nr:glycosyltransferase family 4 protein [Methylomonas paludis]QWF70996.1 glycosyltransferase family 4 protein [Methylomonas paludis]QWF71985.1 glycosyltransferase family 4 protein [Methylomonas paludis]
MKRPLSVMMLGLRGLPNVQGGIEAHVQNLATYLQDLDCRVDVIVRAPYQPVEHRKVWNGIRIHSLWSPVSKSLEAITHTAVGVLYAAIKRPDILHIHAVGPSLMVPLARLLGLKVVVTHHGQDYDRQKWGKMAKFMLKTGEYFGMKMSNGRIVISEVLQNLVRNEYGKRSTLIPNGVVMPALTESAATLEKFGLTAGKYILTVSRLVPEKRHLDLIEAFKQGRLPGWKLVIVGGSDHPDAYTDAVHAAAASHEDVVMTGFQSGLALKELFTHAGMFVLPSSHEGLPIAMLEALSFGLPVIASDIPANLEVGIAANHYFKMGDVNALTARLEQFAATTQDSAAKTELRAWVDNKYNWEDIAEKTLGVYLKVAGNNNLARQYALPRFELKNNFELMV